MSGPKIFCSGVPLAVAMAPEKDGEKAISHYGLLLGRKFLVPGVLLFFIGLASCAPKWMPSPVVKQPATLRNLAQRHDLRMGAAVAAVALQTDPDYRHTLIREFDTMTPENAMKFGCLQPRPFQFDFGRADQIVEAAKAYNMQVRGHTLVWHRHLPSWLTDGNYTRHEVIRILRQHITTVVGRYRGNIMAWDVVNEAFAEDGVLRDSFWLRNIGPEYIAMAFEWAHAADPKALLFYNDYGAEGTGEKSDAIFAMVENLLDSGVPIDGVGLQMHLRLDHAPSASDVQNNMARLSRLGLQVHITEMDVRIKGEATHSKLARQAEIYRRILSACLSEHNCTALVVWGVTDAHSWVPNFFEGWAHALLFDAEYRPKPAYQALIEELAIP